MKNLILPLIYVPESWFDAIPTHLGRSCFWKFRNFLASTIQGIMTMIEVKVRLLKNQLTRWMNEWKSPLDIRHAQRHMTLELERNRNLLHYESAFLQKPTEKITSRIRNEVHGKLTKQISLPCNTLNSRLESFMSNELQTSNCSICYEFMLPPQNTAVLLFPCGHTFCKLCIERHRKGGKNKCPYCREKIFSSAENQRLKSLIEWFAAKKKQLCDVNKLSKASLDCTFTSKSSNLYSDDAAVLTDVEQTRDKYLALHKTSITRRNILTDEAESTER